MFRRPVFRSRQSFGHVKASAGVDIPVSVSGAVGQGVKPQSPIDRVLSVKYPPLSCIDGARFAGGGANERVPGVLARALQDAREDTGAQRLPGPSARSFRQERRVRDVQVGDLRRNLRARSFGFHIFVRTPFPVLAVFVLSCEGKNGGRNWR